MHYLDLDPVCRRQICHLHTGHGARSRFWHGHFTIHRTSVLFFTIKHPITTSNSEHLVVHVHPANPRHPGRWQPVDHVELKLQYGALIQCLGERAIVNHVDPINRLLMGAAIDQKA